MLDLNDWMKKLSTEIQQMFGNRIEFIGLQGSYGRGEATESSDIDVVIILDKLTIQDLKSYDALISKMTCREKICGFISGKKELINWEKSDLFQFYHDTTPIVGSIDYLLPLIGADDVRRAALIGACNIYHMCAHNILHEKDTGILKDLYKSAAFVLQARHFEKTNQYIKKREELLPGLSRNDQEILKTFFYLKELAGTECKNFEYLSEQLFSWASQLIEEYGMIE